MLDFFKKIIGDKKEYRMMMARVEAMPKDYQFVFKKIQNYMWNHAGGDGMDMLKIQYDLIDLFEAGIVDGKRVLQITGEDVAEFCDELLRNTKTWTASYHEKLNNDIKKSLGRKIMNSFSEKVYEVVKKIPKGKTLSYKEVAVLAGKAKACRAVGNILNKNYDPKIPCHRVIRSDKKIGGYNRGNEEKKKKLEAEGYLL